VDCFVLCTNENDISFFTMPFLTFERFWGLKHYLGFNYRYLNSSYLYSLLSTQIRIKYRCLSSTQRDQHEYLEDPIDAHRAFNELCRDLDPDLPKTVVTYSRILRYRCSRILLSIRCGVFLCCQGNGCLVILSHSCICLLAALGFFDKTLYSVSMR